jgi:hypothetical protein
MALDPKTHNILVSTSDFDQPAMPTERQPNPLPLRSKEISEFWSTASDRLLSIASSRLLQDEKNFCACPPKGGFFHPPNPRGLLDLRLSAQVLALISG